MYETQLCCAFAAARKINAPRARARLLQILVFVPQHLRHDCIGERPQGHITRGYMRRRAVHTSLFPSRYSGSAARAFLIRPGSLWPRLHSQHCTCTSYADNGRRPASLLAASMPSCLPESKTAATHRWSPRTASSPGPCAARPSFGRVRPHICSSSFGFAHSVILTKYIKLNLHTNVLKCKPNFREEL